MFATTMPDTQSRTTRGPAEDDRSLLTTDPAVSEPACTGPDREDVTELREALRAVERAYRAYVGELRQGDVEPVEDWSTWYAEYLLGLR